jgi:prefoldin subunit 5
MKSKQIEELNEQTKILFKVVDKLEQRISTLEKVIGKLQLRLGDVVLYIDKKVENNEQL